MKSSSRSRTPSAFASQNASIGWPSTYSSTRYGTPSARDAAVEQPRDVGMVERRENLSLGAEAVVIDLGVEAGAQQLERDLLLERAVGALGEEHARHAAAADLANDAIRADAPALELLRRVARLGDQRGGRHGRRRFEKRSRRRVPAQQVSPLRRAPSCRRCTLRRARPAIAMDRSPTRRQ